MLILKRAFCPFPQLLKSLAKQAPADLLPTVDRIVETVRSESGIVYKAMLIKAWTVQQNIQLFPSQFVYNTVVDALAGLPSQPQLHAELITSLIKMPLLHSNIQYQSLKPSIAHFLANSPASELSLSKLELAIKFRLREEAAGLAGAVEKLDGVGYYGLLALMSCW
jgi:hypothetical protein